MKALITGGAGFLGSHLADALVHRGDEVIVLDNLRRGKPENLTTIREEITFIGADVRNEDELPRYFEGAEVIFHLAAQSNVMGSLEDPGYSTATNVNGTYNVLRAAVDCGARRLVFSSSREVYGDSVRLPVCESACLAVKNLYGATKVAGEAYCRVWQSTYGLECQVLRFANLFGPRDYARVIPLWLERAASGEPLKVYGGDQVLDFLWIEQAVDALVSAADCPLTGPINVGSGRGTLLKDLADHIATLGPGTRVEILPPRSIEVVCFVADTKRMQKVLGVVPEADPLQHLSEMFSPSARAR